MFEFVIKMLESNGNIEVLGTELEKDGDLNIITITCLDYYRKYYDFKSDINAVVDIIKKDYFVECIFETLHYEDVEEQEQAKIKIYYEEEKNMLLCPKCGSKLEVETEIEQYPFVCKVCDENFFEFEGEKMDYEKYKKDVEHLEAIGEANDDHFCDEIQMYKYVLQPEDDDGVIQFEPFDPFNYPVLCRHPNGALGEAITVSCDSDDENIAVHNAIMDIDMDEIEQILEEVNLDVGESEITRGVKVTCVDMFFLMVLTDEPWDMYDERFDYAIKYLREK